MNIYVAASGWSGSVSSMALLFVVGMEIATSQITKYVKQNTHSETLAKHTWKLWARNYLKQNTHSETLAKHTWKLSILYI